MRKNHIDPITFLAVLALMLLGVAVVFSASASFALWKYGDSSRMLGNHMVKLLIGFGAMMLGISVDYNKYKKFTGLFLLLAVGFLIGLFVYGTFIKGSIRHIMIAGVSFQPSEFAKFALIFHICTLITRQDGLITLNNGMRKMLIWIGLVAGLVYLEPNFSTATLILIISTIVLIIGRVRIKDLFITSLAIIPVIVLYLLTKPNQLGRIKDYISGSHSSPQVNYQLWQGIIGFGNGGIFGVGPGASKQRDFFLPESYGDFVFSIVGEEYGLIGTIIIMGLFFLIMLRGFRIANNAPNAYGKLIAVGITTTITIYAIVNAGVTLGIFPTTGLPMPFVSYGGSNLLFSCFAIGVLLNISSQTTMYPRELPVQLDTPQGGLIDSSKGRVY